MRNCGLSEDRCKLKQSFRCPDIHDCLHLPNWTLQDKERTIENWEIHLHPQELAVMEKPCERKEQLVFYFEDLYTICKAMHIKMEGFSHIETCILTSPVLISTLLGHWHSRARFIGLVLAEHSD